MTLPLTIEMPRDAVLDAERVYGQTGGARRWTRVDTVGIRHDNGGIYEFYVEFPNTEYQEGGIDYDEVLTGTLMEPYEKTITAYRAVKAGCAPEAG